MSGSRVAATEAHPISRDEAFGAWSGEAVGHDLSSLGEPMGTQRAARIDLTGLLLLTVGLRIPALLADRHLTFDDGVYGASALAMRAGGEPFREVFSSQGPLFLPLVWWADLLGLRTANSPRLVSIAAAVVLVGVVYAIGRAISDRTGALLSAGLVTLSASILWVTAPVAADGVALALATIAVGLAIRWRNGVSVQRAVVLGLAVGATVSVKALLAPVVLPVALVLLAGRRLAPIVASAVTALAFHLALWVPWGPANVWDQSYGYHLEVAMERTPGRNLAKVLSTMGDRDSLVLAAVVVMVGALILRRRARRPAPEPRLTSPDLLLVAWLGGTLAVLLTENPLWRPHVSQLIPPLALLAARHRPALPVIGLAAVLVVPYHLVHAWPILHPTPYSQESARVVSILRDLPPGALAISDDPGIVWRAGRLTPPDLVDTSILRIQVGQITSATVARAADRPDVCAVVIRSSVRWGSFDDLPSRLSALGYELVGDPEAANRVYLAGNCGQP